jgi:ethanolamine utilization microcompartment shell protein EutS
MSLLPQPQPQPQQAALAHVNPAPRFTLADLIAVATSIPAVEALPFASARVSMLSLQLEKVCAKFRIGFVT